MAQSPVVRSSVVALAILVSLALYWGICLLRNYVAALRLGVPVRIIPIDHTNPIWMLVDRKVLDFLTRMLPFMRNTRFARYNYRGWELRERCRSHDELGDAFVLVTPGRTWLYLSDPDAVTEMFRRRLDFPRCVELTAILDVFGSNISTAEGTQWKKQRKLTATCFNEQNNEIVWSESIAQAREMMRYWSSKSSIKTVAPDTRTLSLHVLSRAGFGKSFKFQGHDERQTEDPSTSYRESLQLILENCILIMALGPKFLADWKPWLPRKLQRLQEACASFQRYMTQMYEEEKRASSLPSSTSRDHNFMTSLVKASQDEARSSSGAAAGLTEQEIYGNMFVLNFAGHDTTAHTFTFALYLLAAHPEVQSWISDELRRVLGDRPPSEWHYASDFPRLKRCLAIMYETIRLFTPVPVAKWTGEQTQTLTVGKDGEKKVLVLPPATMVIPSYSALHTDPKYWGADALSWRPSRWITSSTHAGELGGDEEFVIPRKGTFIGWSEGARDCPGRKFSQVEFVATLAVLFRDWCVDPVPLEQGETLDDGRKRVLEQIETDSAMVLLLQMLHPERAPLVWKRRDKYY